LFSILSVDKDIDVVKMTHRDWHDLNVLLDAFIDDKNVFGYSPETPAEIRFTVQDILILILFVPIDKNKGEFQLYDFFNSQLTISLDIPDSNEKFHVPLISMLEAQDFIEFDNINYDQILPSYQVVANMNPNLYLRAEWDIHKLLSSYDKTKNEKLLITAEEMANWVYSECCKSNESNECDLPLLLLMQVIRRKRQLSDIEIQKLSALIEKEDENIYKKIGAYLLQDNLSAAQMHFNKLTKEEQDKIRDNPIYIFWKDAKSDY
jgi:hypothetical protein